jgi:hypothetical protein
MNYYKYLDLDYKACSQKLKEYIIERDPNLLNRGKVNSWQNGNTIDIINNVPEIIEMLKPLNVTIRMISFYVSYNQGLIHIDGDQFSECRLNIPVLNCENSETRFYKSSGDNKKIYQPDGVPFYWLEKNNCTLVDQFYLERGPTLFRNNEPHQVVLNNSNKPRISCTIGFNEELIHLLE